MRKIEFPLPDGYVLSLDLPGTLPLSKLKAHYPASKGDQAEEVDWPSLQDFAATPARAMDKFLELLCWHTSTAARSPRGVYTFQFSDGSLLDAWPAHALVFRDSEGNDAMAFRLGEWASNPARAVPAILEFLKAGFIQPAAAAVAA
jgi:hypothetical protein